MKIPHKLRKEAYNFVNLDSDMRTDEGVENITNIRKYTKYNALSGYRAGVKKRQGISCRKC